MSAPRASSRVLPSIPASPGLISSVLRLLAVIDKLPRGATGVLKFADHGVILLESRKICWAVARPMRLRLTDILRNQSTPPLPREAVEQIFRRCKVDGRPIGEALVESGLVSEAGLRAALFKHNGEAIAHLANSGIVPEAFVSHTRTGYDPKFSFSPCEVLAMLGSLDDPARALAAQSELCNTLVPDSFGAAFVRSNSASGALVMAVDRACDLPVCDLVEVCNWTAGLFDVVHTFDPGAALARATWGGRLALVAWRSSEVAYVGLCASRAAAARLVSRLESSAKSSGVIAAAARYEGPE
ncbi:MAG TPA: hypothetical protein VJV79_00610 [Polyangiaceae bacterium]|nr:hypothetical protein [Polyangiaceae bacterium]